ncbi:hypothetical protein WBK50_05015 [Pseudonocardia sp. T1-2H]|uniref:hypothetical protein n=1 Tax=Pseudonocardia sp. T1-2H TaxID=3128899 RepID=UPI0031010F1E
MAVGTCRSNVSNPGNIVPTVVGRAGLRHLPGPGALEDPGLEHGEPDQAAQGARQRDRDGLTGRGDGREDLVHDEQDRRAVERVEDDGAGVLDVDAPPARLRAVEGEAAVDLGADAGADQQGDQVRGQGLQRDPQGEVDAGVDRGAEATDEGVAGELPEHREPLVQPGPRDREPITGRPGEVREH